MPKGRGILIDLCIMTLILFFSGFFLPLNAEKTLRETPMSEVQMSQSKNQFSSMNYTIHDPIMIKGQDDFHTQAEVEGWDLGGTRNGSSLNPYIIEGYNFSNNAGVCISISDIITVHFDIKNCIFEGLEKQEYTSLRYGIEFFQVYNARIENNSFTNLDVGIELVAGGKNFFINNSFEKSKTAIRLFATRYNLFTRNNINQNSKAMYFWGSNDKNLITKNLIYNNEMGIGIGLRCDNNTISHNSFVNNGHALSIKSDASNNTISHNDFICNDYSVTNDDPSNQFRYNYWDIWVANSSDNNSDGYCDIPYSVHGTDAIDLYPLVFPINQCSFHFITRPLVIFPPEGSSLNGTVTIRWKASLDNWNLSIRYDIYYSNNSGTSWNLIIMDFINTSYNWNTTSLENGSKYIIKIEAVSSNTERAMDISGKFSVFNPVNKSTDTSSYNEEDSEYPSLTQSNPPSSPIVENDPFYVNINLAVLIVFLSVLVYLYHNRDKIF